MRMPNIGLALVLAGFVAVPALAQTTPQTALPGTQPKTMAPATALPTKPAVPAKTTAPMMAPVNINTATADQLDAVPQIGPKRAASIIKFRPYKSVDELVTKKALSKGIFEKVKAHLTV